MDAVLFTLTLLSLVVPGWAVVTLLAPHPARLRWPETLPLAFLLGAALTTLLSFGLGFVVAGVWLRGLVMAIGGVFSLAVFSRQILTPLQGAGGLARRWKPKGLRTSPGREVSTYSLPALSPSGEGTPAPLPPSPTLGTGGSDPPSSPRGEKGMGDGGTSVVHHVSSVILVILAAQAAVVAWLAWRGTLEWDGLVVWEAKAYLACLNDGRMPLAYFADPSRQWSHPQYPLFVPLLEAWLYGWLGRCDQRLASLLFPLFYLAAAGLLVAGGLRLGKGLGRGAAAALLLFCVPQLVVGAGSAASGYADFPLAVVYLGAVVYLADYALTHEPASLRLAAALALCLPWIKQEGVALALCFLALAGGLLWQRRRGRVNLLLVPSVLALPLAWTGFLAWQGAPSPQDFLPFTLATLVSHLDRLGPIWVAVLDNLTSVEQWGMVWLALPVAWLLLAHRLDRPPLLLLGLSIALPIALYAATYLFSAWVPYSLHIASSLPRLLSHVAPLAVLLLGLAMPAQDAAARVGRLPSQPLSQEDRHPAKSSAWRKRSEGSAPIALAE